MAAAERLQSRIFSGMDSAEAWNEVSVDLVRCAKVNFVKYFNFDEQNLCKCLHVVQLFACCTAVFMLCSRKNHSRCTAAGCKENTEISGFVLRARFNNNKLARRSFLNTSSQNFVIMVFL